MLESSFKADFKKEVARRLPHVQMYEPKTHTRSAPDLIILGWGTWAVCEFKRDRDADEQPNQDRTIKILSEMGRAEFVYPDNVEEVLRGLEDLFSPF